MSATPRAFSDRLDGWLKTEKPKTVADLQMVFAEKSFAVALLLLLCTSALPLPTGGVTHAFELIAMLLSIEMISGRKAIWLPRRFAEVRLSSWSTKTIDAVNKRLRWVERFVHPRLTRVVRSRIFWRLVGLVTLLFTVAAFLSPPFSGLDTLPSLGVVLIALAMIFDDIVLFVAGCVAGLVGIGLLVGLGGLIVRSL